VSFDWGDMCSNDKILNRLREVLIESFLKVFGDSILSLVLFGSYARGEPRYDSDIDLLVVLDRIDDRYSVQKLLDDVERLLEPFLRDISECSLKPFLSPIVLSKDQASTIRPLYIDLVFDAKVLYDKDNFISGILSSVKEKLNSLGAERRRIGNKWVVVLKKDFKFGEVIEL